MGHMRGHGIVRDSDLHELVRCGMADGRLASWAAREHRTDSKDAENECGYRDGHNEVSEMSQYGVLQVRLCAGSVEGEVGGSALEPATLTFVGKGSLLRGCIDRLAGADWCGTDD